MASGVINHASERAGEANFFFGSASFGVSRGYLSFFGRIFFCCVLGAGVYRKLGRFCSVVRGDSEICIGKFVVVHELG